MIDFLDKFIRIDSQVKEEENNYFSSLSFIDLNQTNSSDQQRHIYLATNNYKKVTKV